MCENVSGLRWKVLPRTSASRRYELLLPLRFNDGRRVPDALIGVEFRHSITVKYVDPERIAITQPRVARLALLWVNAGVSHLPGTGWINPTETVRQTQFH